MNLAVSASPHIRSGANTRRIMLDVLIALIPAFLLSVYRWGLDAVLVTAVCVASAVLSEYLFEKLCKKPITIGDLSAVVTGVLLAGNLKSNIPLWQAAFGSFVAIVVVKQLFGGIGKNFANPAIVGRIVLFLSFSRPMTTNYIHPDGVTSATPLAIMRAGETETLRVAELLMGNRAGCLGEVSAVALFLGFLYLLVRKVITWHNPVTFVGTVFVCSWLLGGFDYAVCQVLSGGLVLGAIFMATDYATTPSTNWGQVIFGLGAGLITVLIRQWGNYIEGVSFGILFMNILSPYLSRWTRTKPLGGVKA